MAAKKKQAAKKPKKQKEPSGDPMFSLRLPPKLMARVDAAVDDINGRLGGFDDGEGSKTAAARSNVVRYMLAHALNHWEKAGAFLLLWRGINADGDVLPDSQGIPSPGLGAPPDREK